MGSTQFPQYNMAKLFTEVNKIYDNLLLAKYIKLSYPQKKKIVYMHLYSISVPATWMYIGVVYKLDINLSGTGYEYTYTEDEDYPTHLEAYKNYNLQYSITNNSTNPDDDPESLEIITAEVFADTFRKLFRNIGMWPADSDIPSDYTQITAIHPTGTSSGIIIDTGVIPDVDDFKMELHVMFTGSGSWYIFQSRPNTSSQNIYGIGGSQTDGTVTFQFSGTQVQLQNINRQGAYHILKLAATAKDGVITFEGHDINSANLVSTSETVTGTYNFTASTIPLCLFGNNAGQVVINVNAHYMFRARAWKSGELVMDYIPVTRNSDSKAGFWDAVSKTFKTNDYLTAYGG